MKVPNTYVLRIGIICSPNTYVLRIGIIYSISFEVLSKYMTIEVLGL